MTIEVRGTDTVIKNLGNLEKQLRTRMGPALKRAVMGEVESPARKNCPKLTGHLARHIVTTDPQTQGDSVVVECRTTGVSYAVPVHERLEIRHPNGEAKFLENAAKQNASRVSESIIEALEGLFGR